MKGYLANLRPFERRVVVGVGVLLFLVLNVWFVFPHFSDWGTVQARMREAQDKLAKYQSAIADMPGYERKVKAMESEGLAVPPEDQALHFSTAIQSQAAQSHVNIIQTSKISSRTNAYFLEQSQSISTQSGESELVDFLFNLGAGNSLIRVRDLSLRPDPPRQQLQANIKLVASYQKKLTRAAAPPAGARPAATAPKSGPSSPAPPPNTGSKSGPNVKKS
jgi:Type II secretion system (T2SS), protein M